MGAMLDIIRLSSVVPHASSELATRTASFWRICLTPVLMASSYPVNKSGSRI